MLVYAVLKVDFRSESLININLNTDRERAAQSLRKDLQRFSFQQVPALCSHLNLHFQLRHRKSSFKHFNILTF